MRKGFWRIKIKKFKSKNTISVNVIEKEYLHALEGLSEDGDFESIFFLRLIWETGLRPMDVMHLHPSEIMERRIHRKTLKTGKYENYNMISEETEKLAAELLEKQGKFFSKNREHYFRRIRKNFVNSKMSVWEIAKYSREPLLLHRYKDKKMTRK